MNKWISINNRDGLLKVNIISGFIIKGASMLLSLLFVPLLLGYLTSYKYGIWLTINSVISWFSMMDIGLSGGLRFKLQEHLTNKDYALSKIYVSTTYASLFFISLLSTIIIVSILYCMDIDYSSFFKVNKLHQSELQFVVFFTVCCFFVRFIFQPITSILQADQMNFVCSLILFSENILNFFGIVILNRFTSGSLLYACILFALVPIFNLLLFSLMLFKYKYRDINPSINSIKIQYIKPLMSIGVDFFITSLSLILIVQCNNIIITKLFSPNEVTDYNIVFKLFSTISVFFTLVLTPTWSAFANAYHLDDYNWINKVFNKIRIFYIFVVILYSLMILTCPFIVKIWTGLEIKNIRLILGCGGYFIVQNFMMIYAFLFNGTGEKKYIKIQRNMAIYGAIINIPSILIMVNVFNLGLEAILCGNIISILPSIFVYPRLAAKILNK